ncbi:MAG: flagellar protein FlgN [Hyphomicrobiales bacterium]|nr:flagellar protein FlgN [Hyphomicrobiales bacterium]
MTARVNLDIPTAAMIEALEYARHEIEAETRALRTFQTADISETLRRKDMILLDLTRRTRMIDELEPTSELARAVEELRDALNDNRAVLRLHMKAAQDVSDMIMRAVADAESDRTYDAARALRRTP